MFELIVALFACLVPPHAARALRRTAPAYLTSDDLAREHLAAAFVAGIVTRTDPTDLLSIAWHESRYKRDAVTREPGGRWSCGVMTPEPMPDLAACLENTRSLAAGYLAGARHLRAWLDVRHDRLAALRGYGGRAASVFDLNSRRIRDGMVSP